MNLKNHKIVDLSVPIEANENEPFGVKHNFLDHSNGAKQFSKLVNKKYDLKNNDKWDEHVFPDNEFLARDIITMSCHTGTHIDAPYHYGSKCEGKPSKTVDELPLEWFINEGVKLDFSNLTEPYSITKEMVKQEILTKELEINNNTVVLIETGYSNFWGLPEYKNINISIELDALDYILNKGVKVIGIDTFGFDISFPEMIQKYNETKNTSYLWPTHFYGRKREYIQIERMNNLHLLPSKNFIFNGAPLKIINGEASWIRANAILNMED